MKIRALLVMASLVLCLGCGKGDDDDDNASPTPSAAPGTITATATDITGSDGLVLLGSVYPTGGSPSAPLAVLCQQISGDPGSVTGEMLELEGTGNPCDLLGPVTFDAGDYDFFFGTYVPGQMTPQMCAEGSVTVNGDTDLTVPTLGAGACP